MKLLFSEVAIVYLEIDVFKRYFPRFRSHFLRRPQKLTKFSLSIWQYVVTVKSTVKISSIYVAFLENINFNLKPVSIEKKNLVKIINIFCDFLVLVKRKKSYFLFKTWGHKLPMTFGWPFEVFHILCRPKFKLCNFVCKSWPQSLTPSNTQFWLR